MKTSNTKSDTGTGPESTADLVARVAGRESAARRRRTIRIWLERAIVLGFLLGLWTLSVSAEWVNPIYSATPVQVFNSLITLIGTPTFWTDLVVTLREALMGFLFGSSAGLVAGLVLGRWLHAKVVLDPFLTFFNAVPKIALAPIIILWFGIGETSKVVTAVIVVFFIVQVPTTAAVSLVDPDLNTVVTTMGANERQRFLKVFLPGILSAVFGALRLAAVFSLLTVVFAEFLSSRQGLGQRLLTATNNFDMAQGFALMIVLSLLALSINGLIGLFEKRMLRWNTSSGQASVVTM